MIQSFGFFQRGFYQVAASRGVQMRILFLQTTQRAGNRNEGRAQFV